VGMVVVGNHPWRAVPCVCVLLRGDQFTPAVNGAFRTIALVQTEQQVGTERAATSKVPLPTGGSDISASQTGQSFALHRVRTTASLALSPRKTYLQRLKLLTPSPTTPKQFFRHS